MKRKALSILLVLALVLGCVPVAFAENVAGFTDVQEDSWFADAVRFAVNNQLFNGTTDTTFSPDANMTRGMLVTVLHRLAGKPELGENTFTDVGIDAYYADAVAWASQLGIVKGDGDGTFRPEDNVSREEAAVILQRYAASISYATPETTSLREFSDAASVSEWATQSLSWAVACGIIKGIDGAIVPQGSASRAQVATVLMRFVVKISDPFGAFLADEGYMPEAASWEGNPYQYAEVDIDQDGIMELIVATNYFGMGFYNFAVYKYDVATGEIRHVPVHHNEYMDGDQFYGVLYCSTEYKSLVFSITKNSLYGSYLNYYTMDGDAMELTRTIGWESSTGAEEDRVYYVETTEGGGYVDEQVYNTYYAEPDYVSFTQLP